MFKGYVPISPAGFIIIDDNFEENWQGELGSGNLFIAVIDIYSKRNLPVATNLIRVMLFLKDQTDWQLNAQVRFNKEFNPRWPEVEQEIKKYLLFS